MTTRCTHPKVGNAGLARSNTAHRKLQPGAEEVEIDTGPVGEAIAQGEHRRICAGQVDVDVPLPVLFGVSLL